MKKYLSGVEEGPLIPMEEVPSWVGGVFEKSVFAGTKAHTFLNAGYLVLAQCRFLRSNVHGKQETIFG
jgi:hypothetical protein